MYPTTIVDVSRRARRSAYLLALAVLAVIGIAQFVLLRNAIDDQRLVGSVVNTAGRERFLSQRMTIVGERMMQSATPALRADRADQLTALADEFTGRFASLADEHAATNPHGWPPTTVREIFAQPPYSLAIQVAEYAERARSLAHARDAGNLDNADLNYLLGFNTAVSRGFDAAVEAYAADSHDRAVRIEWLAGGMLAAMLGALVLVFFAIFHPLERRIAAQETALRRRNASLAGVEAGARKLAETLDGESVIRRLQHALEATLDATVERMDAAPSDDELRERARYAHDLVFEQDGFALPLAYRANEPAFGFLLGKPREGRVFDDADRAAGQSLYALYERNVLNAFLYAGLAERELKIKELDQLKSDLIAMLAHDFKGPLTSMIGYAQLLRDGVLEGDEITEAANFMVDSSWRLSQLASDTLTMSLLERNDVDIVPTELDLTLMLRGIAKSYAAERSVVFTSDREIVMVDGDPNRLHQVFQNLVGNAVKYSPDGAPVDVTVRVAGSEVTVEVRDRGIGIPTADLETIFERFSRASNAKASSIKGTGFGLYLAKTLVELHRGTLVVASVEGEGSTFTVTLPLAAARTTTPERSESSAVAAG
jgi:signal transduction histidine kinase